jgi:3-hydroxyacyl-CoA dehydrogenase/enoyl-CoA hydratase/3-hydroxybutyryl-CoA epimerase/enoyl-CoA isomerase
MFEGKAVQLNLLDNGIAELIFDYQTESVNKFDRIALQDWRTAVDLLQEKGDRLKGLLVYSAKSQFIVGADITEFGEAFQQTDEQMGEWLSYCNQIFTDIEDLPFPTVSAINGLALGGGCEMALSTDFRVIDTKGKIGLPETQLGIIPGFGGTVRMPRLIGVDNAIKNITAGAQLKSAEALKQHLVDAVVPLEKLVSSGHKILNQAIEGVLDWKARRAQKTSIIRLPFAESMLVFQSSVGMTLATTKGHYPAPIAAINSIQKGASKSRDVALKIEMKEFIKVAKTDVTKSLVGLFLNDQFIKGKSKKQSKSGENVTKAAVLGAGIMGGGIAYQSASKNVPIIMKDIRQNGLDQGMSEASKLTAKLVKRGKIDESRMAQVLSSITPTLSYGEADFANVDIVVEAVVENPTVKKIVLGEVETKCKPGTILCSNTSTISITSLAEGLEHPENFCGMHFFNPVHRMKLVEIIRGEKTSERAVGTAVNYALKMGKLPIVVNDCPGFLVNRVLFPYFAGFQMLVSEGADFLQIDKVMEKFGWPMGPAYLLDVVGMDTAHHAQAIMADGFPDRMASENRTSLDVMVESERYGQKNSKGYYQYTLDRKGKPKKSTDQEVPAMIASVQSAKLGTFSSEEVQERMMIPMMIETIRCFEEGIVDTPNEADMALIFGIGFPPFLGGALHYADLLGLEALCAMADKYSHLGKLYEPTAKMREMAASGTTYYNQ